MKRKLVPLLVLLLLFIAPTISGREPSPIIPVPPDAFHPIIAPKVTIAPATIFDALASNPVPIRPTVSLKPAKVVAVSKIFRTSHSIQGKASWYCNYDDSNYPHSVCHHSYPDNAGPDLYAAACEKLRMAMGPNWRGKYVTVTGNGHKVRVRLIDWCGSKDKTIDLYRDSMDVLGPSGGGYGVTVAW